MRGNRFKTRLRQIVTSSLGERIGRPSEPETAKLEPLISKLYDRVEIAEIKNPAHHTSLAFDLFRDTPSTVEYVKTNRGDNDATKRFRRMLAEIETGRSPITIRDAFEILSMSNELIGNTLDHPLTGADVGWHFRTSSSFAAKGRLLYNVIRFFRSRTILEIGTAYGMSALFMALAMERYSRAGKLWTIEPEEPQYTLSMTHLAKRFKESVVCLCGWSPEHIPALCQAGHRFDLFFHDNGHSGEAYVKDYNRVRANLTDTAIVIYDDIRWFDRSMVSRDPRCYEGWKSVIKDARIRLAAEIDRNIGIALVSP